MTGALVHTLHPDRSLGDLIAERPARARVLERLGFDYCCHGRRSLATACAEAGLDVVAVAERLAAVTDTTDAGVASLAPVELVEHILSTHHAYLHDELPALAALADKVQGAHGERHEELALVAELVHAANVDLVPHLIKEEQVLFPAIRRLAAGERDLPFGSVGHPIQVMTAEHEQAGKLLADLRATTGHFEVPPDGCNSYRSLYDRLAALEADTFRHIHLENNVLFPAVQALEEQRA